MNIQIKNSFLLAILCLFALPTFGQTENNLEYMEIIEVPNKTKSEIHSLVNEWVAKKFVSAKSVIQMNDKEAGKIICKGNFSVEMKVGMGTYSGSFIEFIISIDSKDGKMRVLINELYHKGGEKLASGGSLSNEKPDCGTLTMSKKNWQDIKNQAKKECISIINSLKNKVLSNDKW